MVAEAKSKHRSVPYPYRQRGPHGIAYVVVVAQSLYPFLEETHMALPPNDSRTPTLTLQFEGSARPPRAIG